MKKTKSAGKWVVTLKSRSFLLIDSSNDAIPTSLNYATVFENKQEAEAIAVKYSGRVVPLPATTKTKIQRQTHTRIQEIFGISNPHLIPPLIDGLLNFALDEVESGRSSLSPKLSKTIELLNREVEEPPAPSASPKPSTSSKSSSHQSDRIKAVQDEVFTPPASPVPTALQEEEYEFLPSIWGVRVS